MNIQELAKKAGMNVSLWDYGAGSIVFTMGTEGLACGALERFAALVLEEAANAVDAMKAPDGYNIQEKSLYDVATMEAADAIRALKGEKE